MRSGIRFERGHSLVYGVADVGFATRRGFRRKRVKGIFEERVIGCERADLDGLAPERYDSGAIAAQLAQEVGQIGLGPMQAGRMHVPRQHGLGDIHGDDQVAPALENALVAHSPPGPRHRDEHQAERKREKRQLRGETAAAPRRAEPGSHGGGNEVLQPPLRPPESRRKQERDCRNKPQQEKQQGMFKLKLHMRIPKSVRRWLALLSCP